MIDLILKFTLHCTCIFYKVGFPGTIDEELFMRKKNPENYNILVNGFSFRKDFKEVGT